jgi:hypothetical protein
LANGGDVEKAVLAAQAALPKYLGGRRPESVRVEEVLPPTTALDPVWKVTLSYLEPGVQAPEPPGLAAFLPRAAPMPERVMKVITIDATTFEARSMTLRQTG